MTLCSLKLSYAPAVAVRLSVGRSVQQQSVAMPLDPPSPCPIPHSPSPILTIQSPFSFQLRGFGGFGGSLKIAHPAVNRIYVRFLI